MISSCHGAALGIDSAHGVGPASEVSGLDLNPVHRKHGVLAHEARDNVSAPGDGGQQHVSVHVVIALGRERRPGAADGLQGGEIVGHPGFEPPVLLHSDPLGGSPEHGDPAPVHQVPENGLVRMERRPVIEDETAASGTLQFEK